MTMLGAVPDLCAIFSSVVLSEAVRRAQRSSLRSRSIPTLFRIHPQVPLYRQKRRDLCGNTRRSKLTTKNDCPIPTSGNPREEDRAVF